MNKIVKVILLVITILFLSLYFSNYNNNYYETKTYLTEEAIKKYEKDLKENKNILSNNYIPEEKNYNNNFSKINSKNTQIIKIMQNILFKIK